MYKIFVAVVVLILIFSFSPLGVSAQKQSSDEKTNVSSGLPLPRFVSLRFDTVRLRAGPGANYPVRWLYKRKHMPVEIIAEFGKTWRQIRDFKGTEGLMHKTQLSSKRTVIITQQTRTLRLKPDSNSQPLARIEPRVIAEVSYCSKDSGWCKITADVYEGWLRRVEFWGVNQREAIN